jgi:G3E family GTPase
MSLLFCQVTTMKRLMFDRDSGIAAIENLMKKKGKFDYILLETTGLANPGPIASMFWMNEELHSSISLDGKDP